MKLSTPVPYVAAAAASLLVYSACSEQAPFADLSPVFSISSAPTHFAKNELRGLELDFERLSSVDPSFAGYYIDDQGDLAVLSTEGVVGSALRGALGESRAATRLDERVRVVRELPAQYSFQQLRAWRDALRPYLRARPDVRYLDLDERANRIVIGVTRSVRSGEVNTLLQGLEVPAEAVVIGHGDPYAPDGGPYASSAATSSMIDSTLSFKFDSVPAGVQIKFTWSGSGACTQGVSARRVSVGDTIFLVSSHCTEDFATTDGADVHQGTTQSGDKIGEEIVDPQQPCGTLCRNADVAVVEWTSTARRTYSRVARTKNANGSRVIDSIPRWAIDVELSYPTLGDSVQLLGQSSGWRKGEVVRTCTDVINYPDSSTGYTLECQDMADYVRSNGDSGGPVFVWESGLFKFLGIHTAARNDTAFFGAMDRIEADLGSLVVVGPFVM